MRQLVAGLSAGTARVACGGARGFAVEAVGTLTGLFPLQVRTDGGETVTLTSGGPTFMDNPFKELVFTSTAQSGQVRVTLLESVHEWYVPSTAPASLWERTTDAFSTVRSDAWKGQLWRKTAPSGKRLSQVTFKMQSALAFANYGVELHFCIMTPDGYADMLDYVCSSQNVTASIPAVQHITFHLTPGRQTPDGASTDRPSSNGYPLGDAGVQWYSRHWNINAYATDVRLWMNTTGSGGVPWEVKGTAFCDWVSW